MRIMILITGLITVISCGNLALAEEMQDMGHEAHQGQGSGMGMMGGKMKMMGMMHKDSVIATSDGGVVVLSGPRLIKYDKDLTLVKEVELPRGKGPEQAKSPESEVPETFELPPPQT